MTHKARKHIWPGGLVMALAVAGVLAVFAVLAASPGAAVAHTDADHNTACADMTEAERADHDRRERIQAGLQNRDPVLCTVAAETPTPEPTEEPTQQPTGGAPDSYIVEGPDFVLQSRNDTTRYTINVLDEDGNPADFSLREGSEIVTVYLDVVDTAQGDIQATSPCLPAGTDALATDRLGNPLDRCSFNMDVSVDDPWFEIFATTIPHGTDIGISLEVDGRPIGDTHTVSYLDPQAPPDPTPAPVTPRDGMSEDATVVSYSDWDRADHYNVTDGYLVGDPEGPSHMLDDMNTMVTGYLQRDEPVVRSYALGVSERENLTTRENPVHGQNTVEVLFGATDVQLTVTANFAGPVYVRLLDRHGRVIGLDVDEEVAERGMDVIGLDSHGRLELPKNTDLDAAKALAYDQYTWHVPGDTTMNAYLDGKAGNYNQGTFRVMDPCASYNADDGLAFSVQVWNQNGTYLQTTERIRCVASPSPHPTGLIFTINSEVPGEGTLMFDEALNAISHDVLLIDASNGNIVTERDNAVSPVSFDNLNNGWTYHIVVVAEGRDNQYRARGVTDYGVRWIGQPDVALSADPPMTATGMHPLCQVEDADPNIQRTLRALLSDCHEYVAPNTDPMAVGSIAAQTVTAGQSVTVDVASYFSDTDMGDSLTYMAMSSNMAVAMASASGSMVTISGVTAGSAIVTVTATDMHGASAMQTISVTVMSGALGAPTNVMAMVDDSDPGSPGITITWTDGANADVHDVGLIDLADYSVYREQRIGGVPSAMTYTFDNVASGRYMAIVVSTGAGDPTAYEYGVSIVTVP